MAAGLRNWTKNISFAGEGAAARCGLYGMKKINKKIFFYEKDACKIGIRCYSYCFVRV